MTQSAVSSAAWVDDARRRQGEYQQELTQAAVDLRAHVQAFVPLWNNYVSRWQATPEGASRVNLARTSAVTFAPYYQRMANASTALRRSMAKVRGSSQQERAWRNTPLYRDAYAWDQWAQNYMRRYQESSIWGHDTTNAGWWSRIIRRTADAPIPTATETGRAVGQAVGTAVGTTQASYETAADETVVARDRALREGRGEGDDPAGAGDSGGDRSWGIFAFGLISVATIIVGSGIALGVKKRYKKNPATCRKLSAHRRALRGRA